MDDDTYGICGYEGEDRAVYIPDTYKNKPVSAIYENAFKETSITLVSLPNSIREIEASAFANCVKLKSITIPSNVTIIGDGAFAGCRELASASLGDGVISIGENAFYGCSGLTAVDIPNSVTTIGGSSFANCSGLTSITIGNGVKEVGSGAFSGCSSLTAVDIPNSVTTIGGSSFANCSGLTSITFGNGIKEVGSSAFSGCSSLTTMILPNSLQAVGGSLFYGCNGLVSLTVPYLGRDKVATDATESSLFGYYFGSTGYSIGVMQRYNEYSTKYYLIPTSLQSVTVSSGRIQSYSFMNCSMLTSITIGRNVASIGTSAFSGCSNLTDIYYQGTMAQWDVLQKDSGWDSGLSNYTIHLTD